MHLDDSWRGDVKPRSFELFERKIYVLGDIFHEIFLTSIMVVAFCTAYKVLADVYSPAEHVGPRSMAFRRLHDPRFECRTLQVCNITRDLWLVGV
jgi:hypothetical protein